MPRVKSCESSRLLTLSFDVQRLGFDLAGVLSDGERDTLIYAADLIRDRAQVERRREEKGSVAEGEGDE